MKNSFISEIKKPLLFKYFFSFSSKSMPVAFLRSYRKSGSKTQSSNWEWNPGPLNLTIP